MIRVALTIEDFRALVRGETLRYGSLDGGSAEVLLDVAGGGAPSYRLLERVLTDAWIADAASPRALGPLDAIEAAAAAEPCDVGAAS